MSSAGPEERKGAAPSTVAYRLDGKIYLNITNRCSADCVFCLAKFTDTFRGYNLRLAKEPAADEILKDLELAFLDGPADEVVFVGFGEPTLRLDEVLGTVEWLKVRRIPSRLNTNGHGQLINPGRDVVAELAAAGLDAASISLVAHNSEVYNQLCRPIFSKAYRAVLKFAEDCISAGIRVTLSVVDLPEVDIEACRSIAERMGADFRVRPLLTPASGEVRS
ncbi:MAG: TatD family nuclease-associated radical SAM protein [Thermoleophilia bacterium]